MDVLNSTSPYMACFKTGRMVSCMDKSIDVSPASVSERVCAHVCMSTDIPLIIPMYSTRANLSLRV